MECPACHKPMIILEFNKIELDFCAACQGCWMDRGELGLLLHGKPDLPDDYELTGEQKSKRRCPKCSQRMQAGILPGTDVEIDVCRGDGVWLDKGEAQTIAREKADSSHGRAFIDFVSSVFGGAKNK